MKPKLRNDTLYLPVEDGAYLLNNRDTLVLKGQHVYSWMERLHPLLDGGQSIDDLLAKVPAAKRGYVEELIGLLYQKGFLKDAGADRPHSLPACLQETYADEIAFIDYFVDSAASRFERLHAKHSVVIGAGNTLVALVRGLLQVGIGTVTALRADETATDDAWLDEVIRSAAERDPSQVFRLEPLAGLEESETRALLTEAGIVLHVSDRAMPGRAIWLDRLCAQLCVPYAAATVVGDMAYMGPLALGGDTANWRSAWWRLRHNGKVNDQPAEGISQFLTVPTASVVASQLAFTAFKFLAGIPDIELKNAILHVDLVTLDTGVHPLMLAPLASGAVDRGAAQRPQQAIDHTSVEVTEDDFSARAKDCVDEYCGVLHSLDEGAIPQLPLNVSEAVVGVPAGSGTELVSVYGFGPDLGSARRRAARAAIERYAAATAPAGRCVIGHDLLSCEAAEITAPDCPAWVASGRTWWEAVSLGLLLAHAWHALREADGHTLPRLSEEVIAVGGDADRYRRQLAALEADADAGDATTPLGVPAAIFRSRGDVVCCVADLDWDRLITTGLEQCVAHQHALRANISLLPQRAEQVALIGPGITPVTAKPGLDDQQRACWLADRLRPLGRPVALPLDHDPAIRRIWPHVLSIALMPSADPVAAR
jgi:putative thiazole-containing bacteriocin maturation protein